MKILLDTCVWSGVKQILESQNYDVIWVGDLAKDPGDTFIIEQAFKERRVLITLDKDFGELAIFKGYPHYGIVRIINQSVFNQAQITSEVLAKYKKELEEGAIITVDTHRIRVRSGR